MSIENATFDDLLIQVRRIEEHRRKGAEIEIKRCYQQLVKDLQEFLGVEYARLAEDDQLTYAILQQKGEQARLLEEVERKINGITPKAAAEIRSVVNDVYAVAYSGMAEAVNTSTSTTQLHKTLKGLPLVSPEVVKRAVDNPINKLTLNDRLERNRKDVIYNINREIGTGLAQGDRMSTMAKRITEQVDIDYRKAMTITRTEVHRVQEAGHCDSARDISSTLDKGRNGMIMAKTWRTMQDESVRPQRQPYRRKKGVKARKKATAGLRSYIGGPNHVKMEGVTVKADELFDLGGGVTADTPGQSGVAGHDVNCRCYASYSLMTVAEFEKATGKSYEKPLTGEVDGGIMEESGEDNVVTKEVDLTDTMLVLEQKGSSRIIGEIGEEKFIPVSTIKEANKFAITTLGIPNASYKGVDIATANAWNKGLQDSFIQFPELKNNFGFVGEAHERNKALKPMLKQYWLDELAKINPAFTLEQLEPHIEKNIKLLMKKIQVGSKTYAQSWSPTVAPLSDFRGVTVNSTFGKKSGAFIESLESDVKSQFHPVGCGTIRSVLDHEIGHQLDDLLDIRSVPIVQELFDNRTHDELTSSLSKYSWQNDNISLYSEMIAEAWAEYCNNETPREIAQTIGEIIKEAYKSKFSMK